MNKLLRRLVTRCRSIDTQAGYVSAYIPTTGFSITDGQIYLEGGPFSMPAFVRH